MKPAIRFALLYAVLSGIYILGSDWAAFQIAQNDPRVLAEWQSFKGIMFVAVSSLLIFFSVYYFERERAQARQQTEAALESFQQLFERNPLPAWVYDTTTLRCLAANEAATTEYGYTRAEFLLLTVPALHPPEDLEKILAFISRIKAHPRTSEWRHMRRDGSFVEMEVTSHPIKFAGHQARLVVVQNIGARKITERILAETMVAKAEAQLAKTRFLSSISHEMRTPLQAIVGYLDLLVTEPEPARREEYGAVVERAGAELLSLIERSLKAAELQGHPSSGKHREVDIEPFLRGQLESFAPMATQAGIELELVLGSPLPRQAYLDADALQEILQILVGNAVKFSIDGAIIFQVDFSKEELHVAVRDKGIGISAEKHTEIFDLFTQGDSRLNRKYGGMGLGLFVARQLCELMGARLTLESTLGEGSCFTVHLPGHLDIAGRFIAIEGS